MHLARVARLEDQVDLRAYALGDQVVVQRADGQQRRDVGVPVVHAAVGEDDQRLTSLDGLVRLAADAVEGVAEAVDAFRGREQRGDRATVEAVAVECAQLREVRIRHDRVVDAQHAGVQRRLLKEVLPRPGGH